MDYKEQAKDLLGRKKNLVSAYAAIKTELEFLEQEKYACKTLAVNDKQTEADGDIYEERLINILADMDDCRFRKSIVERELSKIEKGMEALNDYQRDLIEMFYVEKDGCDAEALTERWFKERSSIYRDKNRALEQFTRSIYGVLQL